MRRAAKVDDNQAAIVAALRKAGCSVQSLAAIGHGCPDILVGVAGRNVLMEIKRAKKDANTLQALWHKFWRGGTVKVVRSPEEAIKALRT